MEPSRIAWLSGELEGRKSLGNDAGREQQSNKRYTKSCADTDCEGKPRRKRQPRSDDFRGAQCLVDNHHLGNEHIR